MKKILKVIFLSILAITMASATSGFFDNNEAECKMEKNCALPFCNCESPRAPVVNASLFKMPQLVVLTIDDEELDIHSYQVYKRLFESFRNPNGCPIGATIFLSDTYNRTSYCLVRDLYEKKFEIAISTLNYTCPHRRCSPLPDFQPWHYTKWSEQIFDMKTRLSRYAGISRSEVVGFRAPLLEPSSDLHFRIIAGDNFLYDSSLAMNTPDIMWPFTFDYKMSSPLSNNGPINSYPGLWELPVPSYIDLENKKEKCLKIWEGHCSFDKSTEGIAKFMRHHFLRSYYNNKAPVLYHLNADWLKEFVITNMTEVIPNVGYSKPEITRIRLEKKEYRNLDGLIKFINRTLENNKDVYFVSARKVIQWMQMIKRVENNNGNETFTDLINELFEDEQCTSWPRAFKGECGVLDQPKPDYDTDEPFELDENVNGDVRKKLKIENNPNSLLTILQTEVLFVNDFVTYFVLALGLILLFFIIRDKFF